MIPAKVGLTVTNRSQRFPRQAFERSCVEIALAKLDKIHAAARRFLDSCQQLLGLLQFGPSKLVPVGNVVEQQALCAS